MRAILFGGGLALLISLLGTRFAIRVLTQRGLRPADPRRRPDHATTPSAARRPWAASSIILATVLGYFAAKLITQDVPDAPRRCCCSSCSSGCGLVGFLDDFIKIAKQRSLGLRSKAKMIGQTVVALVFGFLALSPALEDDRGQTPASHHISFIRDFDGFALPTVVVVLLIWLIVTGTSNAVNLTDGLDGLATGASVMVFGAYTLVNIWQNNQSCGHDAGSRTCYEVRDPLDLAVVAAAITGACFGFLWWNASPAAIFMGDTGSLSLGGALAGFAILTRTELLLVILGGLFVVETLSVMLQVGFFKAHRRADGSSGWRRCTTTSRCSAGSRSPS